MATEVAVKKVDNACETAEEFTKLFYKQLDNSRHLTSKLYLDTGLLVWNGNGINGNTKIQKFLLELPPSNHYVKTLDAQPVSENFMPNNLTYLIQACGDVTYQNEEERKPFQQTFLIVAVDGKWKIASDCYRLQVPYSN
ncbi:NTF2-related export protein-like [Zerene cesonia]|uniref:NTF2-related export protein-like n=1 Tax=Zerene cesonia TaxID=33412 RepID=UPI0018E5601C|nr:NTF2-related export protein-like [Zerene cesonia]XP_038206816.1 NTF2-related export protein-like [Zerene cesonia]